MTEKENVLIRLFKYLGLIKRTKVSKEEMCKQAQGMCDKKCEQCVWRR